jgi:hypothetical protein
MDRGVSAKERELIKRFEEVDDMDTVVARACNVAQVPIAGPTGDLLAKSAPLFVQRTAAWDADIDGDGVRPPPGPGHVLSPWVGINIRLRAPRCFRRHWCVDITIRRINAERGEAFIAGAVAGLRELAYDLMPKGTEVNVVHVRG